MTKTQVVDNLTFTAAMQQLSRIAAATGMTQSELEAVKKDLERRLRPTIIALS
jgi:K+-transporting ATPase c subunit